MVRRLSEIIYIKLGQFYLKIVGFIKHWLSSILRPMVSVQFISVAQSCPTLCDPMDCSTPGLPVHHQLPELTQIHVHWVGDAIQPSYPLMPPSPLALNLSQHRDLFKWVSSLHQTAKYWSFSFSISPSNENPGLISFRMEWFIYYLCDLLNIHENWLALLKLPTNILTSARQH